MSPSPPPASLPRPPHAPPPAPHFFVCWPIALTHIVDALANITHAQNAHTYTVLRKMGMQRTSNRHRAPSGPDSLSQSMLGPSYMLTAGGGRNASQPQTVRGGKKSGGMHGWWRGFDQKFMKPIFGGADPELHRRRGRNAAGFGGSDVNIGSSGDFEVSFTGGGEDGLGGSDSLGAGKVGAELGEESESLVAEAIKEADGVSTTSGGVDASESDIF